jgi:hypothetical protein
MTLKEGAPLEVCYGVAVWDGKQERGTIQAAYARWVTKTGSTVGSK